jgi:hypothetical protein
MVIFDLLRAFSEINTQKWPFLGINMVTNRSWTLQTLHFCS